MTYRPVCVGPGRNPNCWFSLAQACLFYYFYACSGVFRVFIFKKSQKYNIHEQRLSISNDSMHSNWISDCFSIMYCKLEKKIYKCIYIRNYLQMLFTVFGCCIGSQILKQCDKTIRWTHYNPCIVYCRMPVTDRIPF